VLERLEKEANTENQSIKEMSDLTTVKVLEEPQTGYKKYIKMRIGKRQ
jgi:hypothetical protein